MSNIVCKKCSKEKSSNDFYTRKDTGNPTGDCKECIAIKNKKWVSNNKKLVSVYNKRSREKIKSQGRSYSKEYREKNKQKMLLYEKEYREKNKAKLSEVQKKSRSRPEVKEKIKKRLSEYASRPENKSKRNIQAREWYKVNRESCLDKRRKNKDIENKKYREWYRNGGKFSKTEWRRKNKELVSGYSKKHYNNNKEKELERHKKYRSENKDKISLRAKVYRAKNPELVIRRDVHSVLKRKGINPAEVEGYVKVKVTSLIVKKTITKIKENEKRKKRSASDI